MAEEWSSGSLEAGKMMKPPKYSLKPEVYVRECYPLLFQDVIDLVSLGMTFIHISGNPGIGKSCFLWYVLARLLEDPAQRGKAIILQLVLNEPFVITPERMVEKIPSPKSSQYFEREGTWLLTDQRYTGSIVPKGVTLLFASPEVDNWEEARKTNERVFRQLFMPPWNLDELKAVFFKRASPTKKRVKEFWTRYYIGGPVVGWYFLDIDTAFSELAEALENLMSTGTINATLFRGGVDNGFYSHQVFCSWPSADFCRVSRITFLSEWMELSFAIGMFRGSIKGWMKDLRDLADDPQLRVAAGHLFERYAHYRLCQGGIFSDIDNPDLKLVLEPRKVLFFNGNRLPLESASDEPLHKFYLRPNSSNFPLIDGIWLPNVMFQVSIAKRRKAMDKSHFDSMCAQMEQYMEEHSDVQSCVEGASRSDQKPWIVLVKMQGDNSTQSTGLTVAEDAVDSTEPVEVSSQKRRKCASTTKQVSAAPKRKPRRKMSPVQPQMTIVLGEDENRSVNYKTELHKIYHLVSGRMQGGVDPQHFQLWDYKMEELDDSGLIDLLLRGGKAERQYSEVDDDDMTAFGVWMTAVQQKTSDGVFTTVISMECTTGTFLDEPRELKVFINDRIGVAAGLDDMPPELVLNSLQEEVTSEDEDEDTFVAKLETETKASVVIHSRNRGCKIFALKTSRK